MRITVIGSTGQIARALGERAGVNLKVLRLGRPQLDLETAIEIEAAIAGTVPDIIVNAAAFTNVEAAERDTATAYKINAIGAGKVAAVAEALGVPLIHISTEYVFDGESGLPYRETDSPLPLNVYGHSKLSGERAVSEATDNYVILRTSWVYSHFTTNFLTKIRTSAALSTEIEVVADRQGTPTSALEIAKGIEQIASNLSAYHGSAGRGLFHMTCGGETTWAGFASEIIAQSSEASIGNTIIRPISSRNYPELARRPKNSCLNSARLLTTHGVVLAPWRDALSMVMSRLQPPQKEMASLVAVQPAEQLNATPKGY